MHGIFLYRGNTSEKVRPDSKKQVRDMIAVRPENVVIEDMVDGREFLCSDLPAGKVVHFVGPTPNTDHGRFYGTISCNKGKLQVR